MPAVLWGKTPRLSLCSSRSRDHSIAAAISAEPTPRPRHSRTTYMPMSPKPCWVAATWIAPASSPPAVATSVPSSCQSAARASTSTGGSVAMPSRSSATRASPAASGTRSSSRAGRTCSSSGTSAILSPVRDEIEIRRLGPDELDEHVDALARVLHDCVDGGASVSYMHPFSLDDARRAMAGFTDDARDGGRMIVAAFAGGELVGTVQVVHAVPPNQPHRAEIAKLLVHRSARGRGVAKRLMERAEDEAR